MATAENIAEMKKAYPPWAGDPEEFGYSQASDYGQMVSRLPGDVVVDVDAGSYQGDTFVLLRDGDRWGYVTFGWGSCSGCDALQACSSFEEVADIYESLINDIHWEPSRLAMLDWFKAHDWEGSWTWHDDEHREFLAKALDALGARDLKGEAWLDAELARFTDAD